MHSSRKPCTKSSSVILYQINCRRILVEYKVRNIMPKWCKAKIDDLKWICVRNSTFCKKKNVHTFSAQSQNIWDFDKNIIKKNNNQHLWSKTCGTYFISPHSITIACRAGYCGPKNVLQYIAISKKVLQYIAIFINLIWKHFRGTSDS